MHTPSQISLLMLVHRLNICTAFKKKAHLFVSRKGNGNSEKRISVAVFRIYRIPAIKHPPDNLYRIFVLFETMYRNALVAKCPLLGCIPTAGARIKQHARDFRMIVRCSEKGSV